MEECVLISPALPLGWSTWTHRALSNGPGPGPGHVLVNKGRDPVAVLDQGEDSVAKILESLKTASVS